MYINKEIRIVNEIIVLLKFSVNLIKVGIEEIVKVGLYISSDVTSKNLIYLGIIFKFGFIIDKIIIGIRIDTIFRILIDVLIIYHFLYIGIY